MSGEFKSPSIVRVGGSCEIQMGGRVHGGYISKVDIQGAEGAFSVRRKHPVQREGGVVQFRVEAQRGPEQILDSIGQDIRWNLYRATHSNPHFELATYGSWDRTLNAVFPSHRGFQIEPQYPLRPGVRRNANSSISSIGGVHRSRYITGHEVKIQIPDFMVTRVVPQPLVAPHPSFLPHPSSDKTIITIVEIKLEPNDTDIFASPEGSHPPYAGRVIYQSLVMVEEPWNMSDP
ncbi:hypothetical protein FB45DRAFT_867496 [Roridomyces roridus]|uniref:Uncharacterized protein n=1 Tax=Roridomyces roridus TaxID=1738132 RepID=A0AAD7BRX7_9AGAR|nr:hypothetical protein FB45DRAFT_867496 [Roridomyces roridus]